MEHRYPEKFLQESNVSILLQFIVLNTALNSSFFLIGINYIAPGGKANIQHSSVRQSGCQESLLAQSKPFTYSTLCWTCLTSSCQATATLKTHQMNAAAVWEIIRQKVLGSIYVVFCRFISCTIERQKVTDTLRAEPESISIGSRGYELPGQ